MTPLLNLLIATGLMIVGAGLIERQPLLVVAGLGITALELIVWLRRRRGGAGSLPTAAPSCTTCGQSTPQLARGRCPACYRYWHRTGRERPPARWQRE